MGDPLYDELTERRIDRSTLERRTVRSTPRSRRALGGGALMAAVALGLQEVFDPRDEEEIVLEVDASGAPDADRPVVVEYDPYSAARTRAHVRPWLLNAT